MTGERESTTRRWLAEAATDYPRGMDMARMASLATSASRSTTFVAWQAAAALEDRLARDLNACRWAGLTTDEARVLVDKAHSQGLEVTEVLRALRRPTLSLPRVADLGVLAPIDATAGEALGIIAATAKRERALGRLLSLRERLVVLADVCGEVACPPIRSRVCVSVLEAVARG